MNTKQKPKFIYTYEDIVNEFRLRIYPKITVELSKQILNYVKNSDICLSIFEIDDEDVWFIQYSDRLLTQQYKDRLFEYLKIIGGIHHKKYKYNNRIDFSKPYDWNRDTHGSILSWFEVHKIHVMSKFVKKYHDFYHTTSKRKIYKILHELCNYGYIDIIPVGQTNVMILTKVGNRVINYMVYHYDDDDY